MRLLQIAIDGTGKIARDQHIPAIQASGMFELVGCSNTRTAVEGVPTFPDLASMLDALPDIKAVAVCSPPQAHYDAARLALERQKHVLLEKPPCPTVTQLDYLTLLASRAERTLFQSWHLCEAGAIEILHRWLMLRSLRGGRITWREDVRRWHPGQAWLWQADGFGVFDAGINALSVLTKVIPDPVFVKFAELLIPSNCETPIAATVVLDVAGREFTAEFDCQHTGETTWEMEFETDEGTARLVAQRDAVVIDGREIFRGTSNDEYTRLYARFDQLIREHRSEVDKRPLKLVADIFLVGRHVAVSPFAIS